MRRVVFLHNSKSQRKVKWVNGAIAERGNFQTSARGVLRKQNGIAIFINVGAKSRILAIREFRE